MMDDGTTVAAPQNVAEVEQLVKRLYLPGSPNVISQINDQLQRLQLSQDGWKIADELLGSDDANVRFFAALTFTIKLNNDGPSLDAETAQTVLTRLISWLVRLVRKGEGGLVSKKLCSTLTTYFIRSPVLWQQPIRHLALSFHHGDAVPEREVNRSPVKMNDLLQSMTALQLKVLLWFAGALAEETGKISANSSETAHRHAEMEEIVKDVNVLITWSFARSESDVSSSVRPEALQCFLTWINYAQPIWPRNPEALQYLRDLIDDAAHCLLDESLQSEALDIFRDILESYTSFFQPPHMEMLARIIYDHIRPQLSLCLSTQDPDGQPLGQLVTAFGCANVQQVVEEPSNEIGSATILKLHLEILSAPGYPGAEDEVSIQSIEFWNTYIEYVNDALYSKDSGESDPAWLNHSKQVMKQVVELLWRKMRTPPNEVGKSWNESESDGFKDFRLDATDLMLSIVLLLGSDMLQQLVTLALQSLESQDWRSVEAALFCLNTLSDNALEDPDCEKVIGGIFRSSLFREIADFTQNVPSQARRTAIDLLGSYGGYIERHAEFLPDTLRFLFASLEMAGLSNPAAKSIASLCSACREQLTGELEGFLAQYQRFLASSACEPYTKEKVIGAIAAIIQAVSSEETKAELLLKLIANIENDVGAAKRYAADDDPEMAELMGVSALECLASVGKGMQVPDDVPIDVYADDEPTPEKQNYWQSEQGQAVQQRITGCFSVLQIVGNQSAAIDAACQVLRCGFAETVPGPFVLPASVTLSFLQECTIQTPQLDSVLSTVGTLLTQHSKPNSRHPDFDESARTIYNCVNTFTTALGSSRNDPVVAMGCIDVLTRLMPYYSHILFTNLSAPTLDFTLTAIEGPDNFPKRSACDFWTRIIKPQSGPITPETRERIGQVMAAYGTELSASLIRQIGGQAQRSDLDYICDPLKALLLTQSSAQLWLQNALTDPSFPAAHVGMDVRERFLRQLVGSRSDSRKMKEVVRAFWAACRGTVVSYGS